jgi:hypothetical protein
MIYGCDVSTSIIGLAKFNNDGTFIRADYCDLRDVEGLLAKADAFREFLAGLTPLRGFYSDEKNYVFVEERLGNFAAGRTMLQTLMKLAAFNAVCSYILWRHENSSGKHRDIIHLHPSTWKSIMKKEGLIIPKGSDKKKEITLDFVRRKEPDFESIVVLNGMNRNNNPQPWCFDMADAYCLGRSGFKQICIEKESSPLSEKSSVTTTGKKGTK